MQESQSKSSMLSMLSSKKVADGYKRRKLANPGNAKTNVPLNTGEMELEEIDGNYCYYINVSQFI